MQREVLIISPYFPPSQLAGVHRSRHLAKHLPKTGWRPVVLCVDEQDHEQRLDFELARLVPSETNIVKVPALPLVLTRSFGVGDISLRAFWSMKNALTQIVRSRPIELVMITAAPNYHLLLAPLIRTKLGLPVVIDFQDPWVSNWGAMQEPWSKAGMSHQLAKLLESKVLRAASWITSVSERQNEEMLLRRPWLDRSRITAIPIGGDPDDFIMADRLYASIPTKQKAGDQININYVGSYWPAVEPTLRLLLRSLELLRARSPSLAQRLKVNFIGTDSTSIGARPSVFPLAQQEGVDGLVTEMPQRLPYLQAIASLRQADGLLLLGSDEPHYTASKIYSALMSERPYLSIYSSESSAHAILKQAGGGIALSFDNRYQLENMDSLVSNALYDLATKPEALGRANSLTYATYKAARIAERFAEIFERVTLSPRALVCGDV